MIFSTHSTIDEVIGEKKIVGRKIDCFESGENETF